MDRVLERAAAQVAVFAARPVYGLSDGPRRRRTRMTGSRREGGVVSRQMRRAVSASKSAPVETAFDAMKRRDGLRSVVML